MKRLVELDAALNGVANLLDYEIVKGHSGAVSRAGVMHILTALPTVDAVPVVHGRWIRKDYWSQGVGMGERYGYYYSCSKCGNLVCGGYNECGKKYCDECGARMDGKDGDGNEQ